MWSSLNNVLYRKLTQTAKESLQTGSLSQREFIYLHRINPLSDFVARNFVVIV